jgi:hypothetical protein
VCNHIILTKYSHSFLIRFLHYVWVQWGERNRSHTERHNSEYGGIWCVCFVLRVIFWGYESVLLQYPLTSVKFIVWRSSFILWNFYSPIKYYIKFVFFYLTISKSIQNENENEVKSWVETVKFSTLLSYQFALLKNFTSNDEYFIEDVVLMLLSSVCKSEVCYIYMNSSDVIWIQECVYEYSYILLFSLKNFNRM